MRAFSLLLVACLMIQLFAGITISAAFAGGDGRIGTPYLITNASQLSEVRNNLNAHYKLMNNISVGYWSPIGSNTKNNAFKGNFDGNGYTITVTGISGGAYTGFFGYTDGATIKNLHLRGSYVSGGNYTGSFVGYAKGSLVLSNCSSNLNVTGGNYTGGIVGDGYDSNISNCEYTGNVSGKQYVGGVIGKANKSSSTGVAKISRCAVKGTVTGSSSNVGGIVGQLTGKVEECYTTGAVKGTTRVGGISGDLYYYSSTTAQILNSFSTGDITSTSSTGYTGGIAGDVTATSKVAHTVDNCYSTGKIYSSGGGRTGGIAGSNGSSTTLSYIRNCVAINSEIRQKSTSKTTIGRVTGTDYVGGTGYALDSMAVYYKNGTSLALSGSKHGESKSLATLKTEAFYKGIGWNISSAVNNGSIWTMNTSISQYPILRWDAPVPIGVSITSANGLTEVEVGSELVLNATLLNSNDSITSWTSEKTNMATVSPTTGLTVKVKGIADSAGSKVKITVKTAMGATAFIEIEVKAQPVPTIREAVLGLLVGESARVVGLIGYNSTELSKAETSSLTWVSSDPAIAEVTDSGIVTGKSLGQVILTATDPYGKQASIHVLVHEKDPVLPDEITIESEDITLRTDEYTTLSAIVYPEDADNKTKTWLSDNIDVVMIHPTTGKLTAHGPGIATITVTTWNGKQDTIIIEVRQPVTSVIIDEVTNPLLNKGDTLQLSATVEPTTAYDQAVTWKSQPEGFVQIDETGLVTGLLPGKVNITATADGVTSTPVTITVVTDNEPVVLADWRKAVKFTDGDDKFMPVFGTNLEGAYITGEGLEKHGLNGAFTMKANAWENSNEATSPKAWVATIPAKGYTSFTINFEQRSDDMSPNTFILQYSTDGVNWITCTDIKYGKDGVNWTNNAGTSYIVRDPQAVASEFKKFEATLGTSDITDNLYVRWLNANQLNYLGTKQMKNPFSYLRNVYITGLQ